MPENRFKWRITADDQSAKGVNSANANMGRLTKTVQGYGVAARKAQKEGPGGKAGVAQIKGAMDQAKTAADRLVTVAPGVSRYTSTLGQVYESATKAGAGMREAAQSGSGLGAAIGGIAAAAGGAVGIVAALAAGTVKLASGWAEGGMQLAKLSQQFGVSTDDLQKFQGAGERYGVSKEETTASVGGLATTMYDAKSGRNNMFLGLLNQLGLKLRTKKDGTVDAAAEMLDLADAISKQKDPQTQERIASLSGVSAYLPVLRQGRAAMQAEMDDVAKHAAVRSPDSVNAGQRIYRKGVIASQLAGRAGLQTEEAAGRLSESPLDASIAAGRAMADGHLAAGARRLGAATLSGATNVFSGAVGEFKSAVSGLAGLINRRTVGGRLNNPGNVRPANGVGFRRFVRPEDGLLAMGEQIVRDETVHGARTPYDLIAGSVGPDGQRHWGYAPAGDHNDPESYADQIGARSGIGRDGALNPHDPAQLAALMSAMVSRETGSKISANDLLPIARQAIDRVAPVQIALEITGLPAGARVKAASKSGNAVAVAQAGVGGANGPGP